MAEHTIERKIYYHHTDAGGVVYYGKYLQLFEEGRTEALRSRGIDIVAFLAQGLFFVIVHIEIDYKSPARYGDTVSIVTTIDRIGNSSVHFTQEIRRSDVVLVKAKIVWACIRLASFKSQPVPREFRDKVVS
jgi:acyl-CoA thioester hydrolase